VDLVIMVQSCSLQFTLINCISNALALELAAVVQVSKGGKRGGFWLWFGPTTECKQANSLAKRIIENKRELWISQNVSQLHK